MNPSVLALERPQELAEEFKKIGVDPGGISIMADKGFSRIIKLRDLPSFLANIIKQEMLSLGGDAAVSRGSITGKARRTDCLILGNLTQLVRLTEKLKKQPFYLARVGGQIAETLGNFEDRETYLRAAGKNIRLGKRTLMMGIINVTPDSFSGDGVLGMGIDRASVAARDMVDDGADILDVGGESSRPGSKRISSRQELDRVIPFLRRLIKRVRIPVSIDTTKSEVARAALDLGVCIVNDTSALRDDKKMARLVARAKVAVVLMHRKGTPRTMQANPRYHDCMDEVVSFLGESIRRALDAGIQQDSIIVDPGIGFGKTAEHNLEILGRISELKSLGRPILVGVSRKRFIGAVLDADVKERAWGTAAAVSMAIAHGADIIRVHDVKEMGQVARITDAICKPR